MTAVAATPITERVEQLWPSLGETTKLVLALHQAALDNVRASSEPLANPTSQVKFYSLRWVGDCWQKQYRRTITGPQAFENRRPGRFAPMRGTGLELVSSFMECDEAFRRLNDEAVWTAVEKLANEVLTLTGEDARRLAEAVGLALCYRAGLDPASSQLWQLGEEVH